MEKIHQTYFVKALVATVLISFIFSMASFYHQAFNSHPHNDIPTHIYLTAKAAVKGEWPGYTIYHRLIFLFSGFSYHAKTLGVATVGFLTACVVLRSVITVWLFKSLSKSFWVLTAISFANILAMPIFNWWCFPSVYLGQLTPTVWHNPTTIVSMPLAALLFFQYSKMREDLNVKDTIITSAMLIGNTLIKPNYTLIFIFVIGADMIFRMLKGDARKALITISITSIPLILVMACLYLQTYGDNINDTSGVQIKPFEVWLRYSPNIFASLLLSLAYPIIAAVSILRKKVWTSELSIAWAALIIAVLQFSLFSEGGQRWTDANFVWGCHITLFILFLVTTKVFFSISESREKLLGKAILSLHAIAGIVFYIRSFYLLHPYWA
ncbi:MAG: hypothetical protein OEM02_10535 [Desulfobulbaceae bacterium]|nr:hypothetical protein [Desulfobulbaceae bacterium]